MKIHLCQTDQHVLVPLQETTLRQPGNTLIIRVLIIIRQPIPTPYLYSFLSFNVQWFAFPLFLILGDKKDGKSAALALISN